MKPVVRFIAFAVLLLALSLTSSSPAQAAPQFGCADVNGAYVLSQEGTPRYLGFFGNAYAAESIQNPYGLYGSSYSSISVRNSYGSYGSSYGPYSANNPYSSSPPGIFKNGVLVGYLTTNAYIVGGVSLAQLDADCNFTATQPVLSMPRPNAPAWVAASDGEFTDSVVVTWGPVTGAYGYVVGYRVAPDGNIEFADPIAGTSLTITGLTPETVYIFGVMALGAYGNSDFTFDTGHVALPVTNRQLTVSKTGSGAGSVTSSPAGISCGGTCSASFASGTNVVLTAVSASGSTFAGWSGSGCSGTGDCTVNLVGDSAVTATFNLLPPTNHQLTVSKSGTGSGTITSTPAGISCGATCSSPFASETNVVLTAVAASGSFFAGWNGGGCSGVGTCTVNLTGDISVTATFNSIPSFSHRLTVSNAGSGSGTVTSTPAGISCGATCSASFTSGTSVTLSAAAASGSEFAGWSGAGCSGTGSCTVDLNSDTSVSATFQTVETGLQFDVYLPSIRGGQ